MVVELFPQSGEPPFDNPAVTRSGMTVRFPVYEKTSDAGWTLKTDAALARWKYALRAWLLDADATFVYEEDDLTKSATAGWIDHYLPLGATPRARLQWQIVEVDTDNDDADTRSTKHERVLLRWQQAVIDTPT